MTETEINHLSCIFGGVLSIFDFATDAKLEHAATNYYRSANQAQISEASFTYIVFSLYITVANFPI